MAIVRRPVNDVAAGVQLTSDEAAAVLRRAAELDESRGLPGTGLERRALEQAAAEVGISAEALRRALAEFDAGAIELEPVRHGVLGPADICVQRVVASSPRRVESAVERWMRAQTFEPHRRQGPQGVWRPRDDFVANLRRKLDLAHRIRLTTADAVTVTVVEADEGALVRVVADFGATHRGMRLGLVGAPAALGAVGGVAAGVVLGEPALIAAGLPAGAALAGLGTLGGRRSLARVRAETTAAIELFLDGL